MDYYGYAGNIADIDLSERKIQIEKLDLDLVEKYIGGWGINTKLFYDLQKPKIDPFSPDNPIIIGAGSLVGTSVPGSSKIIGTTKSPIEDNEGKHFIDHAVAGTNRFGIMLKNAGYDHLIIRGKSERPVSIEIINEKIKIYDASKLWGEKDTYQTTDFFMDNYNSPGVLTIGRAGEKLVRYAMGIVDYIGTFGRFGLGAVMGSKNLKAIVVLGNKGIKIAKKQNFLNLVNKWRKDIEKIPIIDNFRELGIASGWNVHAPLVQEGNWEYSKWTELYGPDIWEKVKSTHKTVCNSCALACKVDYDIKSEKLGKINSFTGFYLLPARVGQRLELENYEESVKLLDLCNRAGMCFFTSSNIVNWMTRLYKKNIIKKNDVGFELNRNFDTYLSLFNMIINREGFGDLLADGWYPIGKNLNIDPQEFVESTGISKGADAIQDARFTRLHPQAFAAYITNPRPHHEGLQSIYTLPKMDIDLLKDDAKKKGISEEEFNRIFTFTPSYGIFNVARYAKHCEDVMAVFNSLGTCVVYALWGWVGLDCYLNLEFITKIYSAATGIDITPRELKNKGERAFNLYRDINEKEGFSKKDNRCSKIWFTPRNTPEGVRCLMDYYDERQITEEDINDLLKDYYDERGV